MSSMGVLHRENRATGGPHYIFRGAPEDEVLEARPAISSHDDQVNRLLIRKTDDLIGGDS